MCLTGIDFRKTMKQGRYDGLQLNEAAAPAFPILPRRGEGEETGISIVFSINTSLIVPEHDLVGLFQKHFWITSYLLSSCSSPSSQAFIANSCRPFPYCHCCCCSLATAKRCSCPQSRQRIRAHSIALLRQSLVFRQT